MGVSKTSEHMKIKMKMPNPSQDPPAFSKVPNQDFKDMDVLGAFKIKIEGKNLEHGSTKDPDHIQIKIKVPNPSQEPPGSSQAPNQDLKDIDIREFVF